MFRDGLSSRVTFMTHWQPYFGRVLLVAVLTCTAGPAGRARAQEDDAERDQAVGTVSPEQRLEEMRVRVDRQVVFGLGVQGIKPGDLLETLLSRRLKSLASERHLTDAQSNKLRLAGRADIKHFADRLDQIAKSYAHLMNDRDEIRKVGRALQEASSEVRNGFFVTGSLFCKTLARMPGPEPVRGLARVSIQKDRIGEDQAQSRLATLEVDEERTRQELMRLTSSISFKQVFDEWLTGTLGAVAARRLHLEALLADRITELWADCDLTGEQRKILQSAGIQDINRFLERLEQFEGRFEGPLAFVTDFPIREAEALKSSYWRDFGDDTAFDVARAATLSREQLARHAQAVASRNLVRYTRAIDVTAAALAKALRMNAEQARTLKELLWKETRPPRKFGRFSSVDTRGFGDFDTTLVLCQAATISEAKLKAVFGEDLCDKLTRRLAGQRNAYAEENLKRHGFVLNEGPAAARPAQVVTKTKTGNQ
jgi:hypothetical protein